MFGLLLALSNLILIVSGMLNVSCGVGICQGKCGVNACIKYQVPAVNYKFQKCMASTECTGVYAGNYDLFKCSGISDPSGQMSCSNQYCYFHSEYKKNVCLAPSAIGLVNSEYDQTCAAASRNLFKEITDLTNLLAVMQTNFEKLRKADQAQMLKKKQQLQKEMTELKTLIKSLAIDERTKKIHGSTQAKKLGKSLKKKMSVLNQKINQSPPPSNPMTPGTIIAIASLVVTVVLFVVQHFCLKIKMKDSIKKLDEKLSQSLSQNQKRMEDTISEKINPKRFMRQHYSFSRQNIAGREEKSEKVSQQ